ncbi:MAG TPA: ATP-binding protein [Acidobacteriota bacterium]|nr:ATP-binding protein [Acidobacteriota bacterium]
MNLDIRRWTLRSKVVFHVLLLAALSAATLVVVSVTTQRNVIYALTRREAELVGSLTKSSVFFLKKCGRVQDAQAEIHDLARTTEGIKAIRILTLEGRIFASTRPEEKAAGLSANDLELVRSLVKDGTLRRTIQSRSRRAIRSFMLVENGPACYACHDADKRLNGVLEVEFDNRQASDLLWKSQWKAVVPAVLSLGLLIFVLLRLFDRLINQPISLLKDQMKRVKDGDLSIRLEPLKDDEIGRLTASFNAMVGKLKAANQEIETLYNLRIDRAEHLAAFGELAAGLAHEVKNPLAGMKGALEIINRDAAPADPHKEIFQEMLVQIDKLINVIQEFLSYARPKPPRFSRTVPAFFVEDAIRLAKTQVGDKDIRFVFRRPAPEARVCLDADRMQEVVLNLLLNAIAAIDERGTIRIVMRIAPGRGLELFVADDGRGIRASQLGQIFHPFFSTRPDGTGLGLSICKKIIDAHRGEISVRSREKRGTTFVIRLPLDLPCE